MYIASPLTSSGLPALGLNPLITIYQIPDSTAIVLTAPMSELAGGWYYYNFVGYDESQTYAITVDGGIVLPVAERFHFVGNESFFEDIKTLTDPIQSSVDNIDINIDTTSIVSGLEALSTDMTTMLGDIANVQSDLSTVSSNLSIVQADMKRAVGLMHENFFIDNPIYDGNNNMIGGRVRIYSNPASVGTSNDVIGEYDIAVTPDGPGRFTAWQQVRTA